MSNNGDEIILKRILAHFKQTAAKMVNASGKSLSTDQSQINYYDSDFYLEKLEGTFDDVEESRLRRIVFENIDEINKIFFNLN